MTFLELVQRAAKQAGHGTLNIQTVANQTRKAGMFVDWVAEAWIQLQQMQPWSFMRTSTTIPIVAGTRVYAMTDLSITNLKEWCKSSDAAAYLTLKIGDNYTRVRELERQDFIDRFERGAIETRQPAYFCMTENYEIALDAIPIADGTLTGYYWRTASTLVNDDDEPGMNEDWHNAIVGLALKEYAEYDEAPSVMTKGRRIFASAYERMCEDALPEFKISASPMAWGRR